MAVQDIKTVDGSSTGFSNSGRVVVHERGGNWKQTHEPNGYFEQDIEDYEYLNSRIIYKRYYSGDTDA